MAGAGGRTAPSGQPPPAEVRAELVQLLFGTESDGGGGFAVWVARAEDGREFRAAAELAPGAWGQPGEHVVLAGRWVEHPRYGQQLAVESVRPRVAEEEAGVARWLARHKGIGEVTAAQVVRHLGPQALVRLARDPELVRTVPRLTEARAEAVLRAAAEYQEQQQKAQVLIWAHARGFGPAQAEAIWQGFGGRAPRLLEQEPWQLAELDGFGFLRADELAQRLGVDPGAQGRLRAAVLYSLAEAAREEGHVYLPAEQLAIRTRRLLAEVSKRTRYGHSLPPEAVLQQTLADMATGGRLVLAEGRAYLPRLHRAERQVEAWLARRAAGGSGLLNLPAASRLAEQPDVTGQLDPVQVSAVALALSMPAAVLTGGPGTGKTTTVRAVLAAMRRAAPDGAVLLAAPTGRAAKRLQEVTGHEAVTIHRLLDFGPLPDGGFGPRRHASEPLQGALLVIDETSMVDIELMADLVAAIPDEMPVLLVGDADQLPPVGPGAPFHAVAQQGLLPAVVLERIYRQGEGSAIPSAARQVNTGRVPGAGEQPGLSVRVYPRPPWHLPEKEREQQGRQLRERLAADAVAAVRELCRQHGFAPAEVQVLTPVRRGPCGAAELNLRLRELLNPGGRERGAFTLGRQEFWLGDRVMQTKNDYKKAVFNGEHGQVVSTTAAVQIADRWGNEASKPAMLARFDDGREVAYWSGDAGQLSLAYALTVHKAQGSEYPAAVLVLGWDAYLLLQRQLLYTAITRAARRLVILAEKGTLERAAATATAMERYQRLAE